MNALEPLSFRAPLDAYRREAHALLAALRSGDSDAAWRFKWEHPRFRDKPVHDVTRAPLDLEDAQTVVARTHGFERWADLVSFTDAVSRDGPVARFETAVEAVVAGDTATLGAMLRTDAALARARSARRHRATLLHYVAANGVESDRQRCPANSVEIATMLLGAGAEVDALADMYEARCTTLSMLVSSTPPAKAGVQGPLAETLIDHGAALDGPGTQWQGAILTALVFGFTETAELLARRGGPPRDLALAAGLGRRGDVVGLLPRADAARRHAALALAAQLGHVDVVRLLLDAGEDPDRHNPDGFHAHSTPLHQAALAGHDDVVRLLEERGARLDMRDLLYDGTPLGWAVYAGRTSTADLLRSRAAPP